MATQEQVTQLIGKLLLATKKSSIEEAIAVLLTSRQTQDYTRGIIQQKFLEIITKIEQNKELSAEEEARATKHLNYFIDCATSGKMTQNEEREESTRGEVPQVVHDLHTELSAELQTSKKRDETFAEILVENYLSQSRLRLQAAEIERKKSAEVKNIANHAYKGDVVAYLDESFGYQRPELETQQESRTFTVLDTEEGQQYNERHNRIAALQLAEQQVLQKASLDIPEGDRTTFVNFRHYAQAVKTIGQIPEYRENTQELETQAQYLADAITIYEDSVKYETAPPKLLDAVLQLKGISEDKLTVQALSTLSEAQQKEGLLFILKADTYSLFSSKETAPITKVGKVLVGTTFFEIGKKSISKNKNALKEEVPFFLTPFFEEIMTASENPDNNTAVQFVLATAYGEQKKDSFLELIHLTPGLENEALRKKEGAAHLIIHTFPSSREILIQHEETKMIGMQVVHLGDKFTITLPQPFIAFLVKKTTLLRTINFQFVGRLAPILTRGHIATTAGQAIAGKVVGSAVLSGITKIGLLAGKLTGPIGIAITLGIQIGLGFINRLFGKNSESGGPSAIKIGCLVLIIPFLLVGVFLVLQQNTSTQIAVNVGKGLGAGGGIDCSKNPTLPECALSTCVGTCEWPVQRACIFQGPLGNTSHAKNSLSAIDFIGNGGTIFGTPVYSPYAGTVTASVFGYEDNSGKVGSQDGGTYGNHVTVNSPGGPVMLYAHLRNIKIVNVGDSVSSRQLLGYVDHTGYSEGPHLHYERLDGNINEYTPFPVPQCDYTSDCSTKLTALGNSGCF